MQFWAVMSFVIAVFFMVTFMVSASAILGEKSYGHAKNKPFESGIIGAGSALMRFDIRFYMVAVLFIVFDVEALYLYGWAVAIRSVGWTGLIGASIFIIVLLCGLYYDVKMGVLNWVSFNQKAKKD